MSATTENECKASDLAGQVIGRWTVIERAGTSPGRHALWLCRCHCGREETFTGYKIRKGLPESCGRCGCDTPSCEGAQPAISPDPGPPANGMDAALAAFDVVPAGASSELAEAVPIGESEARDLCDGIRSHIGTIRAHAAEARRKVLRLYEGRGWLALGHRSWAECIREEFGVSSEGPVWRQLGQAMAEKELQAGGIDTDDIPGSHLTELAKAPEGERAAVYREAVEAAGGEPKAADIRTVVNGEARADPKVEAMRRKGLIPIEAFVEVTDPGEDATDVEDVRAEHEERAAIAEAELSPEDWARTLPLAAKLEGKSLTIFLADAAYYRFKEDALEAYAKQVRAGLAIHRKATRTEGAYAYLDGLHLRRQHPKDWKACPPLAQGGCGGTGTLGTLGQCGTCHGRGYTIQ